MGMRISREDIYFHLFDVLKIEQSSWFKARYDGLSRDDISLIVDEFAKFVETEIEPTNRDGDCFGAVFSNGNVTVPESMKEVYWKYVDQKWQTLAYPERYDGQDLPVVLRAIIGEAISSANMALSSFVGLSHFAMAAIVRIGTESQKQQYLPRMVAGEWTGTMCLTEPQCGSDIGLIRTRARHMDGDAYSIHGTKIFISCGDHDVTDNIVHLVLARAEGSPKGVKGLSLFIVPKRLLNAEGMPGELNNVNCGSIERKMGIHGSPTCVLNFEGAVGYLLGEINKGCQGMFICMNEARVATAVQALGVADLAFHKGFEYAKERTQSKSVVNSDKTRQADPIVHHPDVRRMLMLQKVLVEGSRALCLELSCLVEAVEIESINADDHSRCKKVVEMLTPICKAFVTEAAFEVCNNAIQIFGGHGYIWENGVEQLLRDVRVTTLYEGTTGIQGLDLLGRKIISSPDDELSVLIGHYEDRICAYGESEHTAKIIAKQNEVVSQLVQITAEIKNNLRSNPAELGSVSTDYLYLLGYVVLGYQWIIMSAESLNVDESGRSSRFSESKVAASTYYFDKVFGRCRAHMSAIATGATSLYDLDESYIR